MADGFNFVLAPNDTDLILNAGLARVSALR
jgi:hypothetical protein